MNLRNPLRRLRLIPSVLVLGTVLLVVKGVGLAVEARAQEQSNVPAPAVAAQDIQNDDPAADDTESSSAQVDVLTGLAKRRAELDARQRDLDMRENLLAAAEKRVDAKIDSLKQLQAQIQALLVQRDGDDEKQIASLVKAYSSMAPKDAARIFDNLDQDVLLAVAEQMKPADLAPVLAKMQAEAAQKLTVRLAERLKLPDAQAQTAQAATQPAAPTMPSTQTPAPAQAGPPPPPTPATGKSPSGGN